MHTQATMENLELHVETLLGELANDDNFTAKVTALKVNLRKVNGYLLEAADMRKSYDSLPDADKVQLDLLQLYAVNTLFFINLKLHGVDVSSHPVKVELNRVKEAMTKNKLLREKPKPRIDKKAAERFVRSGLWDPNQPAQNVNKKKRFDDKVDVVNYDRW